MFERFFNKKDEGNYDGTGRKSLTDIQAVAGPDEALTHQTAEPLEKIRIEKEKLSEEITRLEQLISTDPESPELEKLPLLREKLVALENNNLTQSE